MNWNFHFLILFYFSSFYFIKGDKCNSGNENLGTCKLLTECPSAVQMILNHQNPVMCSYNKHMPMVCCLDTINQISTTESILHETENLTTLRNITPTTHISSIVKRTASVSSFIGARTTRISEQECSSYQNVKLKPREKLDYIDNKAVQQKLENMNNEIAEFPHRVVLGVSTAEDGNVFVSGGIKWQCSGSLISSKFVLTAAHCLKNIEWANIGNALLHTYFGLADPEQILCKIIRRIPHPLYKAPSFYHNIGLVELDRPVEFTLYTRPACLHVDQDIDPNTQLIAAGWGLGNFANTSETLVKLQNINLDLFTEDECERTYQDLSGSGRLSTGILHKEQFCAGARSEIRNTCKIFSGGTLQFDVNSSFSGISYIVGVKSFGNTCGLKGVPSVYTRVSAYVSWIESVVWPQTHDHTPISEPLTDAFATQMTTRSTTRLSDEKCRYLKYGHVSALFTEFPHTVALGNSSDSDADKIIWKCGGTLISEKFVLTSAFCLTKNLTWANVGDKDVYEYLKLVNREQLVYKIIRQIPHPLYKAPAIYHDIALVELDRPVEFNKYARPACLHDGSDIDSRTQFVAIGWNFEYKSGYDIYLRKINLDILTSDGCEGIYKSFYGNRKIPNGILHDYQFCAGGHIGIQDTCLIDLGSPLQYKISDYTGKMWHIFGVETSGTKCGRNGLPRIYTRVAPYVPWIESIVWPQPNPQTTQQVIYPSFIQAPLTQLSTSLSNGKCLYYREVEIRERNLIFKPTNDHGVFGSSGSDTAPDEFPHMVALGFSKSAENNDIAWLCGGSLLNEKFVLTAAHCLVSKDFGNLTWALVGTTRTDAYLKPTHPEPLLRKIIRRIKHPLYKRPNKYHDIALVELDRPIAVFAWNIRPACLYTNNQIDDIYIQYKQLITTGWGLTERGNISIDLQKINLDLFTPNECDEAYEYWNGTRQLRNGILHRNQICAGGRHEIQDTCPGDSGGPIQFREDNFVTSHTWQIFGITSFGKTCGLQGVPGVYTRVAAYVPWIESVVWPNEYIHQDEPEIIDACTFC